MQEGELTTVNVSDVHACEMKRGGVLTSEDAGGRSGT